MKGDHVRIRTLVAFAALGTALAFLPATAQAEEQGNHCVIDMSGGSFACFGTFTEAISYATGGRVTTVPNDVNKAQDDPKLKAHLAEQAAAEDCPQGGRDGCILSIEYEDDEFDDSSLTARGPFSCSGPVNDIDYELAQLPAGWNDRIGSFRGSTDNFGPLAGLCFVQHFRHSNFQGDWIGPSPTTAHMGNMDDETSSIRWT